MLFINLFYFLKFILEVGSHETSNFISEKGVVTVAKQSMVALATIFYNTDLPFVNICLDASCRRRVELSTSSKEAFTPRAGHLHFQDLKWWLDSSMIKFFNKWL